jgi:hypothetical protein
MRSLRSAVVIAVIVTALFTSACGDDTPITTSPTTPTSPTTSTLSTTLTTSGAVSRLFTATQAGTVSVTLNSAGAPGTAVGLGVGVPSTGIARCTLSTSIVTAAGPGPQLSAPVDAGTYCVAVYDLGTLTDAIAIDLTIVFP